MDLNVKSIDDIILTQKVASKKGAKLKPSRNVAFLIDAKISATAPLLEERLSHLYEGFTARNVVSEAEGKFVLWQSSTTSKAGATPNLSLVQKVITDCGGEDALGIKKWGGTTSDKASMQVSLNMITMLCLLHDVASSCRPMKRRHCSLLLTVASDLVAPNPADSLNMLTCDVLVPTLQ
jgi:hypothetical protein